MGRTPKPWAWRLSTPSLNNMDGPNSRKTRHSPTLGLSASPHVSSSLLPIFCSGQSDTVRGGTSNLSRCIYSPRLVSQHHQSTQKLSSDRSAWRQVPTPGKSCHLSRSMQHHLILGFDKASPGEAICLAVLV